eukprot:1138469-Rhodomonas_salina.1
MRVLLTVLSAKEYAGQWGEGREGGRYGLPTLAASAMSDNDLGYALAVSGTDLSRALAAYAPAGTSPDVACAHSAYC